MLSKKLNYRQDLIKLFLVLIIISFILFPLALNYLRFDSKVEFHNSSPTLNDFSKEDYHPILSEEKYALGNITVNNIDLSDLEDGFFIYNASYPLIYNDYISKNLNASQVNIKFVNTTEPAIIDNLNEKITDNTIITVILNESIFVEYNNQTEGYFIYHARQTPSKLSQLFVNNGTDTVQLDSETDYSVDRDSFVIFDYESYFHEQPKSNFTLYFIWEFTLELLDWSLNQNPNRNLVITSIEQNFTVDFTYFFHLLGQKFNVSNPIPVDPIVADNIYIALTVNLPDQNLLTYQSLTLNDEVVDIDDHLNPDNSIAILLTDLFSGIRSDFSLNFTTTFVLKFLEPIGKTWAIDRLVRLNHIRERIYFPSLINGPEHILLKFISFYEPAIFSDQVVSNYSLFERDFKYLQLNTSLTGREGIEIRIPYLIAGETCPCIIRYSPTQTLRIVITDNVKMPLIGADVNIYYFGKEYGTYIAKDRIQPVTPGKTDENGEVVLQFVPNGNYTVRVYYNGIFLKESISNTHNYRNYIYTNYPHFPVWLIIFGGINGIILIIGTMVYIKHKNER